MINGEYTETEKVEYGALIASIFCLSKDRKGRYKTRWGNKTAIGIFEMIATMGRKIYHGEAQTIKE